MKKAKLLRHAQQLPLPRPTQALGTGFVTGLITHGLLASLQGRGLRPKLDRRTARIALQGGSALAAGSSAAAAWQSGRPLHALGSVAAGVAAVAAIEYLLHDKNSEENEDGQEEA